MQHLIYAALCLELGKLETADVLRRLVKLLPESALVDEQSLLAAVYESDQNPVVSSQLSLILRYLYCERKLTTQKMAAHALQISRGA